MTINNSEYHPIEKRVFPYIKKPSSSNSNKKTPFSIFRDRFFFAFSDKKSGRIAWKCKFCWNTFFALSSTDVDEFNFHVNIKCDKISQNMQEEFNNTLDIEFGKE
jgi:hypothetical protein